MRRLSSRGRSAGRGRRLDGSRTRVDAGDLGLSDEENSIHLGDSYELSTRFRLMRRTGSLLQTLVTLSTNAPILRTHDPP